MQRKGKKTINYFWQNVYRCFLTKYPQSLSSINNVACVFSFFLVFPISISPTAARQRGGRGVRGTRSMESIPKFAVAAGALTIFALVLLILLSPSPTSMASAIEARDLTLGSALPHLHFPTLTTPPVMAFYYLWYGSPEVDGTYRHWNHEVLPHWDPKTNARVFGGNNGGDVGLVSDGTKHSRMKPGDAHSPPANVHSPFYPSKGCYSSMDPATLDAHVAEVGGCSS